MCNEKLKDSFKLLVYENDIAGTMFKQLKESVIDGYMEELVKELNDQFRQMNELYLGCIQTFRSAVDDRDRYKEDIELHNIRKANIHSIGGCISDFMQVWDLIITDMAENETEKPEMAAVSE